MKDKKKLLIVLSIVIGLIILGIGLTIFIINKNKNYYYATLNGNEIVKYISKKDKIVAKLGEKESKVYYNDELVGIVKIKKDNDTITEEFYYPQMTKYKIKRVYYMSGDNINRSEYYDYNNKLVSKSTYENNKVVKVEYEDCLDVEEFKEENNKLYSYYYRKDILYSKCVYDDKKIYEADCKYYNRDNKVTEESHSTYNKYGFKVKYKEYNKVDNSNYEYDREVIDGKIKSIIKQTNKEDTNVTLELYDLSLFGSKLMFNTPYLYNSLRIHSIKKDGRDYYYDMYSDDYVVAYKDKNAYYNNLTFYGDLLYYSMNLNKGIKIKSIDDYYSYINNKSNHYNIKSIGKSEYEYVNGYLVKELINSKKEYYYDWYDGSEISKEEYLLKLEELRK